MSNEIFQAIEAVGREKGIDVEIIIQAVEDAYAAAAKKHFHTNEDLGARFDRDTGVVEVFARKRILDEVSDPDLEITSEDAESMSLSASEEGVVEIPKPREELLQLGRIAAQAAKQIIFQKVREAERDNIYREYIGRVGEMINGVVKRTEYGNLICLMYDSDPVNKVPPSTRKLATRVQTSRPTHKNGRKSSTGVLNNPAYRTPSATIMIAMLAVSQNGPRMERR